MPLRSLRAIHFAAVCLTPRTQKTPETSASVCVVCGPLRRTAETQRNGELWQCTLGHFRPHTPPQPFLREEVRVAGDGAPDPEGSGAARGTREEAPRVTMRENRPRISRISQMACKPDGLWRDRPGSPVPDSAILAAMLSRSFLSVPFAPSAVKPGLEGRVVVEAQPRPRRWAVPGKWAAYGLTRPADYEGGSRERRV